MATERMGRVLKRALVSVALFATPLLGATPSALAQEAAIPVPKFVIYPGTIIQDSMLTDVPFDGVQGTTSGLVQSRSALIGKRAKSTLLPGRAILTVAVENPRIVTNGAQVTIIFNDGGLQITTSAMALQDGSTGDVIRVRNTDSGLTVSGIVQANGTVLVSGG